MSAKNVDYYGRFRSVNVSFRVSPEEGNLLNSLVKISGLTKQDYVCNRCLERDVVVQGNPRVYKALKEQLAEVLAELRRLATVGEITPELLETINLITVTMDGMKGASV